MASRVGKYLLFETLGEGAFGKVKLGVHEETGEQVAVKIMDKSDIKAQEMTMNVRREIAIMKALKHKNIVNLRCVLTSNSKLYIVMDVVTGGELFTKILNEGKLEENIARRYFQQLVDGVEYCHRRGVCHRDLKPENLLIDDTTGELKITDFGLSAMRGANTTEELLHTQCGSPNYCAPEIIARHKEGYNGAKVDAWSCGIILFALLAGFLPFYDENTKVLYRMIQKDEVKFPRRFPPDAKDLVLRLLHKEPEKRISLPDVKKHPWFVVDYQPDNSGTRMGPVVSPPASKRKRGKGHSRRPSMDVAAALANVGDDTSEPSASSTSVVSAASSAAGRVAKPASPDTANPAMAPSPNDSDLVQQQQAQQVHAGLQAQQPQMPQYAQHGQIAQANQYTPHPQHVQSPMHVQHPYRYSVGQHPAQATQGRPQQSVTQHAPSYQPRPTMHDPSAGMTSSAAPPGSYYPQAPPPTSPQPPQHAHHYQPLPPPPSYVPQQPPYMQPQPLHSYQQQRIPAGRAPAPLPPPPSYQMPQNHRSSVGLPAAGPPSYAAPSPPRLSRYPPSQSSGEVTPSPSMELPITGSVSMVPSVSVRGGIDNVPSYASLVGAGASSAADMSSPPSVSNFPPAPPFPAPETFPESPETTPVISANSPRKTPQRSLEEDKNATPPLSLGRSDASANSSKDSKAESPRIIPDSAWQNRASAAGLLSLASKIESESKLDAETAKAEALPASKVESQSETANTSAPLSMVQQRRMMFNQLAEKAPPPAPVPVASNNRASFPLESKVKRDVSITEGLVSRYDDRPEVTTRRKFPVSNDVSNTEASDPAQVEKGASGTDENESNRSTVPERPETMIPMKRRLDAALHRYRRIFMLGNSVGITTSPSFGSKGGGLPGVAGTDDETPRNPRAKFFARAKAVTGAWGVILTQELADLDDSDEETQVTEAELQAFGKLLDFWDSRRMTASITGSIVLDDDAAVPLSDEDLAGIQSLLQKLEPNAVDTVEEIADEDVDVAPDQVSGNNDTGVYIPNDSQDPSGDRHVREIENGDEGKFERNTVVSHQATEADEDQDDDDTRGLLERDFSDLKIGDATVENAVPQADVALPPPPPPPPAYRVKGPPILHGPGAPVTAPTALNVPPPPPPPPFESKAGVGIRPAVDVSTVRMSLTDSTVRDPFRPTLPPYYPGAPNPAPTGAAPPSSLSPAGSPPLGPSTRRRPTVSFDTADAFVGTAAARPVTGEGSTGLSTSKSVDGELDYMSRRKSSLTGEGSGGTRSNAGDQTRANSGVAGASGLSEDGGSRVPRDGDMSVAQRGMFGFGVFARRPSTTSFDSGLDPHKCIIETARILTSMGCTVMVKKQGEGKIKCEVPLRKERMLVSVTCAKVNGISTIAFKRGRRDRSRANEIEFQEFVETVSGLFARQTRGSM